VNGYEPLVAYGTEIPSNANLNTTTYVDVGTYYQADSSKVTTFTNCPTTNALTMIVRNVTKTDADTSAKSWQYIVREITDINGNKYIQRAYCVSVGSWTFGAWYKICTTQVTKTNITPSVGSNYSTYGNSYYEVNNNQVHIHLGLQGLTPNTVQTVYTMPSGYRPSALVAVYGQGGLSYTSLVNVKVETSGSVKTYSQDAYCVVDLWYTI
jgi:hypothetical protein